MDHERLLASRAHLVAAALALGAQEVAGWSTEEQALCGVTELPRVSPTTLAALRKEIHEGEDPLGDTFCRLYSPAERRGAGATYTPAAIVELMAAWSAGRAHPERIIDPGAGSGRFTLAAARRFPRAQLVAVELDPLAALLGRANLAAAGFADRARVLVSDYRAFRPGEIEGQTLYFGNPPYVRHHQLSPGWKEWLALTARAHGLEASRLAGLHVHFFLATTTQAAAGDLGAFITSAEWLDVNYGSLVRGLILHGLGGESVDVLEPTAKPFEDADTTAAITCFQIGSQPTSVRLRQAKTLAELGTLGTGQPINRERLAEARRWTPLMRTSQKVPEGHIELGELCRVHRGAVTGQNATWIVPPDEDSLPEEVLFPSVTRARELFAAGAALSSAGTLRRVVDIPPDLDLLEYDQRRQVERFIRRAKRAGASKGYVARYRRAWWSVGLRPAAPILATYMARRPPAFVRNLVGARHINVAHGLYPRESIAPELLDRLAAALSVSIDVAQGRTYAGGLTKFEPREMERLPVPDLAALAAL